MNIVTLFERHPEDFVITLKHSNHTSVCGSKSKYVLMVVVNKNTSARWIIQKFKVDSNVEHFCNKNLPNEDVVKLYTMAKLRLKGERNESLANT